MDYYLIKGHFHVVGYSPDGDSLMFEASSDKHWDNLQSEYQAVFQEKLEEGKGSVQLRLQGVDALETHYGPGPLTPPAELRGKSFGKAEKPSPGGFRQPDTYGEAAINELLSLYGVEQISWKSGFGRRWIDEITVVNGNRRTTYGKKNEDRLEGYIVVGDIDRKGRPIAWVFAGKTSSRNGSRLTDSKLKSRIKRSANYHLTAKGLVYPYFFMTLSAALREPLMQGVQEAQQQKLNLWADDRSQKGLNLRHFSQLTEDYLIFPYLFRRLVKHQFQRQMEGYWDAVANKKSFKADPEEIFLDSFFDDTNPYVFLIDQRDFVRLDSIVYVTKTKLKMRTHPGNIVFLS
ncbi:MAG: hypothetical protein KDD06_15945 [Phaeodactylibacter sp.]|nr:hypothetical protein [Phaeodactylibacter sp.]MCB9289004.1 hypothetical protein [Lewinellaceae bacterium]